MRQKFLDYQFVRHSPSQDQIERYDTIRNKFKKLAELVCSICPECREREQALVNLEQAMFWANASIAREKLYQEDQ